jgi:hypothetical protein
VIESDVPSSPHKNSAMVFWPVVRSLHRINIKTKTKQKNTHKQIKQKQKKTSKTKTKQK